MRDLCPEFRRERWVPDSAFRLGREARYLLLLAVIVYFSAIHKYVPLLAPVSFGLAIWLICEAVRRAGPLEKTIIDSDTEAIVTIPHFERIESARKAFEDALSRMIRDARDKAEEDEEEES